MAGHPQGRWVQTYATDLQPGDRFRAAPDHSDVPPGEHCVIWRGNTSSTRYNFDVQVAQNPRREIRLPKLSHVEILDLDGSVAARVQGIGGRK